MAFRKGFPGLQEPPRTKGYRIPAHGWLWLTVTWARSQALVMRSLLIWMSPLESKSVPGNESIQHILRLRESFFNNGPGCSITLGHRRRVTAVTRLRWPAVSMADVIYGYNSEAFSSQYDGYWWPGPYWRQNICNHRDDVAWARVPNVTVMRFTVSRWTIDGHLCTGLHHRWISKFKPYIDGSVQDCSNSLTDALGYCSLVLSHRCFSPILVQCTHQHLYIPM